MTPPSPSSAPRARAHRVAWLVVAAACAFLAVRGGYKALTSDTSDFAIYHAACRAVLAGDAPSTVHGYLYLPGFAALLAPLGWLPHDVAAVLWQAAGLACLLWSARTLARALRPVEAPAWSALDWLPLLLLLRLVDSNFGNGQVNALTLGLVVLAWRRLERGRALEAGAWIGLGGALKLLPLALVVLLVQRRAWRATAVAVATFALLGLASPALWLGPQGALDALAAWWHDTAEVYARGGAALLEARDYLPGQSLVAAGYRLLCDVPGGTWADSTGPLALDPDRAAWVVRAASAAHLALLGFALWRARGCVARPPAAAAPGSLPLRAGLRAFALAAATALLLAPLVHKAHALWLLPGCAALLVGPEPHAPRAWRRARLALAVGALLLIAGTAPLLVGRLAATRVLSHNTIFFGLEAAWLALLGDLWWTRPRERAAAC